MQLKCWPLLLSGTMCSLLSPMACLLAAQVTKREMTATSFYFSRLLVRAAPGVQCIPGFEH